MPSDVSPPRALPVPVRIEHKLVFVMDLVESVVHMARDEAASVARWYQFVTEATALVDAAGGHVVKSLGDGLLALFDDVLCGVDAAQALHELAARFSQVRPVGCSDEASAHWPMYLRIGLNATSLYTSGIDVFGNGVNLAARLLTLAGPGETIASESLWNQIRPHSALDVEDLGECHLKHLTKPVRAYRIGPAGTNQVLRTWDASNHDANRPLVISVRPFISLHESGSHVAVNELIADAFAAQLLRVPEVRVIHGSGATASHVLSGNCMISDGKVRVTAKLTDVWQGELIWMERQSALLEDLFQDQSKLVAAMTWAALRALVPARTRSRSGSARASTPQRMQSTPVMARGATRAWSFSSPCR